MIAMKTKKDVYPEYKSATWEFKCFEYLPGENVVQVSEWHESDKQTGRQQFF